MNQAENESKPGRHNAGRPVMIKDKDYQTKAIRERKGIFHVWGYQRTGGKAGAPSMNTVAIVELEDGRITAKNPDYVTFLDR